MFQHGEDICVCKRFFRVSGWCSPSSPSPFIFLFNSTVFSASPYKYFVKAEGLCILLRDSLTIFLSQGLEYLAHRCLKTHYFAGLTQMSFPFSASWNLTSNINSVLKIFCL